MTLPQFLLILRARIWVALLVTLLAVAATATVSLLLPRQYTASTTVLLDVKSPDALTGLALQGMMAPGYMATQIDIINSDRVAMAVVRLLGLHQRADFARQWQEGARAQGDPVEWLAHQLQKKLEVKPSRESNVISISFTAAAAELAADIANAFAKAYIEVNLDLRLAPARQYAAFFEEQTRAARDRLELAQQALSVYQQSNGITSADERLDFETTKLNETSSQLTSLQGQTTDSQSKRGSVRTDTLAEVMQSPLIGGLKADIARLEARLTEASVNLGQNHPQIVRIQAELATLRRQLVTETARIGSAIETAYQIGKQREAQLKAALAAQKTRVLALNRQRDELSVLRRDIELAQRAYEVVAQRASQSSMESQTNQTNITVLGAASAPLSPSRPRVLLNTALALFIGALSGILLALVLELLNRRVRSRDDLPEALGLPLLGSVESARSTIKTIRQAGRP